MHKFQVSYVIISSKTIAHIFKPCLCVRLFATAVLCSMFAKLHLLAVWFAYSIFNACILCLNNKLLCRLALAYVPHCKCMLSFAFFIRLHNEKHPKRFISNNIPTKMNLFVNFLYRLRCKTSTTTPAHQFKVSACENNRWFTNERGTISLASVVGTVASVDGILGALVRSCTNWSKLGAFCCPLYSQVRQTILHLMNAVIFFNVSQFSQRSFQSAIATIVDSSFGWV